MSRSRGWSLAIGMMVCSSAISGQVLDPPDCRANGQVLPYVPLREADVMWERRVWRTIDLHETRNMALSKPQGKLPGCLNLWGVIRHGLRDEGGLVAYASGPTGEDQSFRAPLSSADVQVILSGVDTLPPSAISRFMLKEDWIFDKARSIMEVRIISIAPMVEGGGEDGELRGHRPLFWLYYPECRQLFAWWTAIAGKEGERLSYEEFFAQRRFNGVIVKVGSMRGGSIATQASGLDALLESAGVRDQLFWMGFDLWSY